MNNKHSNILLIAILFACGSMYTAGQTTLAEKLGYDKDAKLLIVHADDIGLAASVNRASIDAYEGGGITSGSVMVPCPWFHSFAEYAKSHPDIDVGIHITLTAEWDHYKWDGVLHGGEIPSLLDEQGYFYPSVEKVGLNVDPAEAEKEIRAQIDRAIAFGINPTHLDTHMGSVLATPELAQIYMKLGMEYDLPFLLPRVYLQMVPEQIRPLLDNQPFLLDAFFMLDKDPEGTWAEAYGEMLERVVPGLNQLIVHVAYDDEEMQAVAVNHPAFGSAWRQKDLEFVLSEEFQSMLREHQIHLVGWKEIKEVM